MSSSQASPVTVLCSCSIGKLGPTGFGRRPSIILCSIASSLTPSGPLLAAVKLFDQFREFSDLEALSRSIELCNGLVQSVRQNFFLTLRRKYRPQFQVSSEERRHHVLIQLCRAFCARYRHLRQPRDLETAATFGHEALSVCNMDSIVCPLVQTIQGDVLELHSEYHGNLDERYIAEELCKNAISVLGLGHPLRPMALRNLAMILQQPERLKRVGQSALDEAVRLQREAVDQASIYCPHELYHHLSVLGQHLLKRDMFFGHPDDLEEALIHLRSATDLCPPAHVERVFLLFRLSKGLAFRYNRFGLLEELEEALDVANESLALAPPGSPNRGYTLEVVGDILRLRALSTSTTASDLDKLVEVRREAYEINVMGKDTRSDLSNDLANSLRIRYLWSGRPHDLEEAIELRRTALENGGGNSPSGVIGCLAEDLYLRFKEFNRIEDLYEAVRLYRQQMESTPAASAVYYEYCLRISTALCTSAQVMDNLVDLEEAVNLAKKPVQGLPEVHPMLPHAVLRLSNALLLRMQHLPEIGDLNYVIQLLERHAHSSFTDSCFGVEFLRALCLAFATRFNQNRREEDAHSSLEALRNALSKASPGRRERFDCLMDMAELYLKPGTPYRNPLLSLQYMKEAITDDHRNVRFRVRETARLLDTISAQHGVAFAANTSAQEQLLEVYADLVALLPRVAYFGLDISSRLQSLAIGQNIAVIASSHALKLSQTERAIEMLEQGRNVFWTHALRLRSQFDDVPDNLRNQLVTLAQQLERSTDISYGSSDERVVEKAIAQRRQQSDDFASLVKDVRTLPGLQRFMLEDEYSTLASVADRGPVVILVSSVVATHAVVIRASTPPLNVPLSSLTEGWLLKAGHTWRSVVTGACSVTRERLGIMKARHSSTGSAIQRVLGELWLKVVQPILDVLRIPVSEQDQSLLRET
jgi:tetratricopeptide (TPR) repeat protein